MPLYIVQYMRTNQANKKTTVPKIGRLRYNSHSGKTTIPYRYCESAARALG